MKSRLTIEVDFENANEPVIQILQNESEDVRDSLIKSFLQGREHQSRWLKIQFKGNRSTGETVHFSENNIYHISVIRPKDFKQEIALMEAILDPSIENERIK